MNKKEFKEFKKKVLDIVRLSEEIGEFRWVTRRGKPIPTALMLTVEASRDAGHLEAEGRGGSPEQREARRATESLAHMMAVLYETNVEIHAEDDDGNVWQVGVEEATE